MVHFMLLWFILNYNYHTYYMYLHLRKSWYRHDIVSRHSIACDVLHTWWLYYNRYSEISYLHFQHLNQKFNTISRPTKRRYIRPPNRIDLYYSIQTFVQSEDAILQTNMAALRWRECKWTKTWFIYCINWTILW